MSEKRSFKEEFKAFEVAFREARPENGGDQIKMQRFIKNSKALTDRIRKESKAELYDFLKLKRSRGMIDKPELNELNEYEAKQLKDYCECYHPTATGLKAMVGNSYKYMKYFDESRECDMYITYITETIDPEFQESKELAWKRANGIMPDPNKDFAKPKVLTHRFPLRESEWRKHFREIEL